MENERMVIDMSEPVKEKVIGGFLAMLLIVLFLITIYPLV